MRPEKPNAQKDLDRETLRRNISAGILTDVRNSEGNFY